MIEVQPPKEYIIVLGSVEQSESVSGEELTVGESSSASSINRRLLSRRSQTFHRAQVTHQAFG